MWLNRKATTMDKHDPFKYVKPNAPTESGLYWPEQMDDMWSYCTYLGSISISKYVFNRERNARTFDLGCIVQHGRTLDATTDGPEGGNYYSGEVMIGSRDHNFTELEYLHTIDGVTSASADSHYVFVVERCIKYGIPVRAWSGGPNVIANPNEKGNDNE
jgi:hypothetical protein